MRYFIRIIQDGDSWSGERIDSTALQSKPQPETLVGILPQGSQPIEAVWVLITIDENSFQKKGIQLATTAPPGWNPMGKGEVAKNPDGSIRYRPVRASAENYNVFCRMIPIVDQVVDE